jgi:hypothetical protein
VEEDLDHLCHGNGGLQRQWLAAAADGGGNGLVAGGNEKSAKTNHPWLFWGTLHRTGAMLIPIQPTLQHLPQYALCHSVETFTNSLVKRMVNVQKEGGRERRLGEGKKLK